MKDKRRAQMTMTEEKRKYFAEYKKKNLKKVQTDVNVGYYERIKRVCELEGISTTRFVKEAVNAELEAREKKYGIDPSQTIEVQSADNAEPKPQTITLKKKIVQDPNGGGAIVVYVPENSDL